MIALMVVAILAVICVLVLLVYSYSNGELQNYKAVLSLAVLDFFRENGRLPYSLFMISLQDRGGRSLGIILDRYLGRTKNRFFPWREAIRLGRVKLCGEIGYVPIINAGEVTGYQVVRLGFKGVEVWETVTLGAVQKAAEFLKAANE
ncbi:MAG: hypothetical protein WC528_02880 [Patescibacteria group bacterium]